MSPPLISVIIPTYRREAVLRETIAHILQQDHPSFEVLVIDQTPNHEPQTQIYLEELAARQAIRWYRVAWASLPGARNYGVRRSKGEIIVFIDDDVQIPSGFLAAHLRNYQRSEIGGVAGRVFDRRKLETEPDLAIDILPPQALDPGVGWFYVDLVHTVKPQRVLTARGCNMSFRRSVFEAGLRFDERFRGSAVREESDFCLQLRRTGLMIWYDPDANLVHLGEETGGCHDISIRSLHYQITFYHNHFWMACRNLTIDQSLRLYARLFDCHVLGHPPCNKNGSWIKVLSRSIFFILGWLSMMKTWVRSVWNDGQIYSRLDEVKLDQSASSSVVKL